MREEAERRGLTVEREDLIRVGTLLRREHGSGALAERILPRLGERDVVDSIRNPAEVSVLRSIARFVLVGVRAPVEMRFARSTVRGRAGDPADLEEFRRRERQENTSDPAAQQLEATFRLADRVLDNDSDVEGLRRKVDSLLSELDA